MTKPRPPYLLRETTRHGKIVWYFRVGSGRRTRIKGEYGSPEFQDSYRQALSAIPEVQESRKASGSFAWAVDLYMQSQAWAALSVATRRQRGNILKHAVKAAEDNTLKGVTKKEIMKAVDRRAATPAAGRHFVETMRSLFKWAIEAELATVDPTEGIVTTKPKSDGFPVWEPEDIAAFQSRWPRGSRERVAFDVLLYTGLRRGDAVRLGRPHVREGVARITTEKTAERVAIKIEPELAATIEAGPIGEMTFIASEERKPLTKESFGNWFRDACRAAGVRKSAHGLRKTAATRDAESGYSEAELEAKYGWRGGRMASHYTRSANRERLSIQASERVTKLRAKGAGNA